MKKLLLSICILLSVSGFAQLDTFKLKSDQLQLVAPKTYEAFIPTLSQTNQWNAYRQSIDSFRNRLAALENSNALALLTEQVKTLSDRIAALEALAPGLPEPVIVNGSAYTITANDNAKTIFVYTNATITLPVMNEGFKCKVYRMGNGRPRFVSSGITLRIRSGFSPLSVQYAAVNVDYKEGEVVVE